MCGIAGFWDRSLSNSTEELALQGRRMLGAIKYRGPDDEGVWLDEQIGVVLGMRRLAIVDLSPTGKQPMLSANERYVIVYNGEMYNFPELRQQLPQYPFKGTSDTEVVLAGISEWGIEETLRRCVGMFAFALWDREERTLTLARDHLGIKPLYYGWQGAVFMFGSELKALRQHTAFTAEINAKVLPLYLRHNAIPAPYSIYQNIYKLMPGTYVTLRQDQRDLQGQVYWSVRAAVEAGAANPFTGRDHEAADELERHLREAVRSQMIADVPLGAFLSGGIDSSVVVALMQVQSDRPVKTFTIGNFDPDFDEAKDAKAVAAHLGTEHTELFMTEADALGVIPLLPQMYDEPFGDSSQIPTFLVSKLARQHVTVALSGDGGDELFGGYNRHLWVEKLWDRVGWMPRPVRKGLAHTLNLLKPDTWEAVFGKIGVEVRQGGDKMQKVAEMLRVDDPREVYRRLISHWTPAELMPGTVEPPTAITDKAQWAQVADFVPWMMALDAMTYLPDDILTKVDRASMACSLEARVPLLDHRMVEFAWRLPMDMKIRDGQGKWILRQVLYRYIPQNLVERPKSGFAIPLARWLREDLKDWAAALLDPSRLKQEGYFQPEPIQQKWQEHLEGKRNWQYQLWDILMFQAWLESVSSKVVPKP